MSSPLCYQSPQLGATKSVGRRGLCAARDYLTERSVDIVAFGFPEMTITTTSFFHLPLEYFHPECSHSSCGCQDHLLTARSAPPTPQNLHHLPSGLYHDHLACVHCYVTDIYYQKFALNRLTLTIMCRQPLPLRAWDKSFPTGACNLARRVLSTTCIASYNFLDQTPSRRSSRLARRFLFARHHQTM